LDKGQRRFPEPPDNNIRCRIYHPSFDGTPFKAIEVLIILCDLGKQGKVYTPKMAG